MMVRQQRSIMGLAFDVLSFLLVLASIPLAFIVYKFATKDESARLQSFLGEKTLAYAMLGLLLLLLVPYGAFILLPVILCLSFLSPAGRLDWRENRTQRLVAIGLVILMLGVSGLVPLDPPRAPEEWESRLLPRIPTLLPGQAVSNTHGSLLKPRILRTMRLFKVFRFERHIKQIRSNKPNPQYGFLLCLVSKNRECAKRLIWSMNEFQFDSTARPSASTRKAMHNRIHSAQVQAM